MKTRFILKAGIFSLPAVLVVLLMLTSAAAQQMTNTTTQHRVGDSYGESIGTQWGLSGKNWYFNYGGAASTPQFGNYNPAAGVQTGTTFNRRGVQGYFNAWAGQSTERYAGSTAASLTTMNGEQGYIGAVTTMPFVIGVTPVVGGWYGAGPPMPGPYYTNYMNVPSPRGNQTVREALERVRAAEADGMNVSSGDLYRAAVGSAPKRKTAENILAVNADAAGAEAVKKSVNRGTNPMTAETPTLSVAEMRKMRAAEQSLQFQEARELVEKGKNAEKNGDRRLARSYYKQAIPLAEPEFGQKITRHLEKME